MISVLRIHFETLPSTNTWAKENADSFNPNVITLITADEQTAGRGRFERSWSSPAHLNLYATFCYFIPKLRPDIANLAQVVAIAACTILERLGFHPTIRWPNDLLVNNKKLAGILCETTPIGNKICLVMGIGININMPIDLLNSIDQPATSLLFESQKQWNVETVLDLLQKAIADALPLFLSDGFDPFQEKLKQLLIPSSTEPRGQNL